MSRYAVPLALAVAVLAACQKAPPRAPEPPAVVPEAPPPAPAPPAPEPVEQDEYTRLRSMDAAALDRLGLFQDVHFDYDRADILDRDRATLSRAADTLRKFDFLVVTVEGHCDERGSVDYNLALGERRARAARDYLVSLGVPEARLKSVSYGKESPLCQESNESCWARNRRAHFAVTGKTQ